MKEYSLKLDSFFFDKKNSKLILFVKVRNKRAMLRFTLPQIMSKEVLPEFHPIDLFTIAVLANNQDQFLRETQHTVSLLDDFLMVKVNPIIDVIEKKHMEEGEIVVLKIKSTQQIVNIKINELSTNKFILSALKHQDAISLGYFLEKPGDFIKSLSRNNTALNTFFPLLSCCIFLLIFISCLINNANINILFNDHVFSLKGELLFTPLIFFIQTTLEKYMFQKSMNHLLQAIFFAIALSLIYIFFISFLPMPNDSVTATFNQFLSNMKDSLAIYLLVLAITNIMCSLISKRSDAIFYINTFLVLSAILRYSYSMELYSMACYIYFGIWLIVFSLYKILTR